MISSRAFSTCLVIAWSFIFATSAASTLQAQEPKADIILVELPANDIVYDLGSDTIYATVPSRAGIPYGNHVVPIDPGTGALGKPVFAGSEPSRTSLMTDGSLIYMALDGNNRVIPFDISTQTMGESFEIGEVDDRVEDIEVVPGHQNAIVVSLNPGPGSSRNRGLVVFVNGAALPKKLGGPINVITFSDSPDTLYGHTSGISPHNNLMTHHVDLGDGGGITTVLATPGVFSAFQDDIQYDGGRIYGMRGEIVNPETHDPIGRFELPFGEHPFVADATVGRSFFALENKVKIFDQKTFLLIDEIPIPELRGPRSMIRFPGGGLAIRAEDQIFLIRSPLIGNDEKLFLRGNTNDDEEVNISDASYLLNWLFLGGPELACLAAGDSNSDGAVNLSDASYLLNWLFLGGPDIGAPFPDCGPTPEDEPLECAASSCQ